MHDLVIKGGTIVDGTGAPTFDGDVAVDRGTIAEVGRVDGPATRTIDADGLLVTPGFVDIHTHYDGQVTWDPLLTPSCWQGVTTLVMGNCGVGFAPAAPDKHEWLIGLMEGVEDIPGAALSEGIEWTWESYPDYLAAVARSPLALDVGSQVPHGAVRAYVMGERGASNEPATPEDIEAMARIVAEGIEAGALGFSTSRTLAHRAIDGEPVPGTFAAEDELFGIGEALGRLGAGVFELAPAGVLGEDLDAPDKEIDWMLRLAAAVGRPVSFALTQNHIAPGDWRRMLDRSATASERGVPIRPQVHARTVSLLLGLQTFHPLNWAPSWGEIGLLPLEGQVAKLRQPEWRARLVAELETVDDPVLAGFMNPARMFPLGDPPDYEPPASASVAARAGRERRSPWDVCYELLLERDGRQLLNSPVLNYADGNLDAAYEMLVHPATTFGLGDGGAHAGQTCDASSTTFLLTHWARDRTRGPRLPLETAVRKITAATADLYGLRDRGRVLPGYQADLNLIDFERLQLRPPELVHDLPAGGRRLVQTAAGYVATISHGVPTFEQGEHTGALPGGLLRGAKQQP
ncbi:MAG: amidohydrolase family protein [Actinobacteria bacterium]|nr:amidohydrolase family protein [Actinomycetota bacterium]